MIERRFRILQFCATFVTQNTVLLITSYFGVILHLFHFSQITQNMMFCYAEYSIEIYAKYKFSIKMFRKLQNSILRKIQVSQENFSQNTVVNCCAQSSQNTDSSQNTISPFEIFQPDPNENTCKFIIAFLISY